MLKSRSMIAWAAMAVVFVISFLLVHWLGAPKGNPDHTLLYAVAVVFAASAALLTRELVAPRRFPGDATGLGAFRLPLGVAVMTVALAGLGVAFVVLRHPVVAGFLSGAAFAAVLLHPVITLLLAKICWGVPIADRPSATTIWRARVAQLVSAEKNEVVLDRLQELQRLCARQPEDPRNPEDFGGLRATNLEIEDCLAGLRGLVLGSNDLDRISSMITELEKYLDRRLSILSGGSIIEGKAARR